MSSYLECYIEVLNKETNKWENLSFYKKTEAGFEPIDVYSGSASGCGDVLLGSRYIGYSNAIDIQRGVPEGCSQEIKDAWEHYKEHCEATWYDYCELNAYMKALDGCAKHIIEFARSKVIYDKNDYEDYELTNEVFDEYSEKIEAFEGLMNSIDAVLNEYGIYRPDYGQVRIVFWIS